ncbi:MAG: hypothetical protein A2033_08650 [Bacteroidetes bacterium GWA2_31_9]|nr:MAG: hypothetical protein A2033_08650 [Bacteroidetes bacterium GWA2_31_9]
MLILNRRNILKYNDILLWIVISGAIISIFEVITSGYFFSTISPQSVKTSPISSSFLIVLSLYLIFYNKVIKKSYFHLVFKSLIASILVFSLLSLIDTIFNSTLNFNCELIGKMQYSDVKMTSVFSFYMVITSLSILFRNKDAFIINVIGNISFIIFLLSLNNIIGFIYETPFYNSNALHAISLPASISFMLISLYLLIDMKLRFWPFKKVVESKTAVLIATYFIPTLFILYIIHEVVEYSISEMYLNHALHSSVLLIFILLVGSYIVIVLSNKIGSQISKAESTKLESELKYRTLFENAIDGIIYINMQGKLTALNSSFASMHGYSIEEMNGMELTELDTIEVRKHIPVRMKSLREQNSIHFETEHYHKDGHIVYFDVIANIIKVKDEEYVVAFHRDMTERKKSEMLLKEKNEEIANQNEEYQQLNEELISVNEELLKAKIKAIDSDKLKTAFLANMSHEIRTPLNGIMGFIELLHRKKNTDEKKAQYIDIINSNSSQLISIIDDLIDIAKIESNQLNISIETTDVGNLLSEIFFSYSIKLSKTRFETSLILDNENTTCIVATDKNRLKQIVENLLNNAIKFTSNGEIHFGFTKKSDFLEFYVKDNGIGIEEINLEKIFDRFWQVEKGMTRKYGGTGIGLSICKAFIEKLGGKIWVESEVMVGSTFYFTIPINKNDTIVEKIQIRKSMKISDDFKNASVLIAEDEDMNYFFFEESLEDFNVKIIRAKNGNEAVEIAKSTPDLKLILMDIKMPIMNGYEATRLIKQIRPELPIIAQTAYAQIGDREKAIESGCDDYISKPVNMDMFNSLLTKYLS